MSTTLPPLPRSDGYAIERNIRDNFYKVKSRDFWGEGEVVREEIRPFVKCDHKFHATESGVSCQKCHMGLKGPGLEIRDGKLFYKNEPIKN